MSNHSHREGQKDARDGKPAADMQNAHWKERQDYNAGHAVEKAKTSR
jgi:hypothetical protein